MLSSPKKSLDRTRFPASVSVKQPERVKAARVETGIGRLLGRAVAVEKSPERSGAAKRPKERDGMAMKGRAKELSMSRVRDSAVSPSPTPRAGSYIQCSNK